MIGPRAHLTDHCEPAHSPGSTMSSRWIISARPVIAEDAFDLTRVAADKLRRMGGAIGHEPAADLAAGGIEKPHAIAA